jgi:hypothetical protein
MKRTIIAAAALTVLSASLAFGDEPQIAYRFLGDYVAQKEAGAGDKTGAFVMYGIGSSLLAASALSWFAGDAIAREAIGAPIDPELRFGLTLGFGIGGLASIGIGAGLMYAPVKDYRLEFDSVFGEDDPELREAMAAATLREMADRGHQTRMASAIGSFLVPAIAVLASAYHNVTTDQPWENDALQTAGKYSWSLVSGVTSLLSKSKEELLYERYLAARAAIYDARR